jgi:hypothetical protein
MAPCPWRKMSVSAATVMGRRAAARACKLVSGNCPQRRWKLSQLTRSAISARSVSALEAVSSYPRGQAPAAVVAVSAGTTGTAKTKPPRWNGIGPGISPRPPLGCPHHSPRTRLQIKQFVTARQGYLLLSLQWAGAGSPGAMSNSTDGETRSLSPPRIARALMPQAPLAGSRFWRFEIDVGGDVDARTVEGDLEAAAIFAGHIPLL